MARQEILDRILKYIDPHMGVLRFTRIGFPYPNFTAHFVGTFEITCGLLVLLGLFTRLASIPLLIIILTAIATTTDQHLGPAAGTQEQAAGGLHRRCPAPKTRPT